MSLRLVVSSLSGWMTAPSSLRIHIPPELTAGATVRPDAPTAPHVYTFAV